MYRQILKVARNFVDIEKGTLNVAMKRAAPFATGRLLDVGCGDKPYKDIFSPFVREYIGVEYDETFAVNDSARRGQADVVYSGDTLPFPDGWADTVLSNQVAEHVPDPTKFFSEIARVLKPGGRLILTAPFSFREHSAPNDFHRFTQFALMKYARDNALVVDLIEPRGGMWSAIGQKLAAYAVLEVARLGADLQTAGAMGYENTIHVRPRYWALPAVAPAVVGIVACARLLEHVAPYHEDTLGYLLVATKAGAPS